MPATDTPLRHEYCDADGALRYVILPDNDGPGKRHADAVQIAPSGVCASLLILPLQGRSGLDDVDSWFRRRKCAADKLREIIRGQRYDRCGLNNRRSPIKVDRASVVGMCRLRPHAKLVLCMLLLRAWHQRCILVAEFADECGIHRVRLQQVLADLRRLGLIAGRGVPASAREDVRWDLLAGMCPPREAEPPSA